MSVQAIRSVVEGAIQRASQATGVDFSFLMKTVQSEVLSHLTADKEKILPAWKALLMKCDYATYGGAPLLGIDGACIICHGSSKELAIKNALKVAFNYAKQRLDHIIVQELQENPPPSLEKA